jgi:hypothetical protein
MKDLIRKVLKEELSNIIIDGKELGRKSNWEKMDVDEYLKNGYKPYRIKNTEIYEVPAKIGQKLVNRGYEMIYFFNDEEMVILNKLSNKITEMKEEYKKAISLWDKYLLSFIETSGKI